MSGLFNGSANFKLEQYKVERDDTEKFMKTGVEELRLAEEEEIRDAEMARKRCNVHNFTELNMKSNVNVAEKWWFCDVKGAGYSFSLFQTHETNYFLDVWVIIQGRNLARK